jgi:hypothetical protein
LEPNYEDETVGCVGAWRKGNEIKTIVYWREGKEKGKNWKIYTHPSLLIQCVKKFPV